MTTLAKCWFDPADGTIVRAYVGIKFDNDGWDEEINDIDNKLLQVCNKLTDSSNRCNECNRLSEKYYGLRDKYNKETYNNISPNIISDRTVLKKPVTPVTPVTDSGESVTPLLQLVIDSDVDSSSVSINTVVNGIDAELRQAEIEVAKREAHFTTPEHHTGLSQAKQES